MSTKMCGMPGRSVRMGASTQRQVHRVAVWCLSAVACVMFAGPAFAQQQAAPRTASVISGTVKDPSGARIAGAVVTLQAAKATEQRTTITDQTGGFRFSPVAAGRYKLTVAAGGFAPGTADNLTPGSGDDASAISVVLQLAASTTTVDVTLPPHELAAEQIKAEEKQRVIGIFPNFFVTYQPNAAPLTAAQKFQLGWKAVVDPVPILLAGIAAGIQQGRNSYAGYGQGVEGYAKRFGANYADHVDEVLIGHVLMQSVFHQDPRYYYKGKGSFGSRALYAFATAFVVKGDNGHWQPAYADVLGGIGSYELSTLYRPGTSRPGLRLAHTVLLGFAGRVGENLFQEFVFPKFSTHVPKTAGSQSEPTLRAGTPVPLISVEDLGATTAQHTGPIRFVLASDIRVDGVVVAKAGSEAWGRVNYRAASGAGSQVELEHVSLTVGKVEIPLRSTQIRSGTSSVQPVQYHQLENSRRIALTLYADKDVALEPAQ